MCIRDRLETYNRMLELNPDSELAANNVAAIIADHRYEDREALERARRLAEGLADSRNPLYLDTLGWVLYRMGDYNRAEVYLREAVDQAPGVAALHYHLGAVLAAADKPDQAREQLDLALGGGAEFGGIEEARELRRQL